MRDFLNSITDVALLIFTLIATVIFIPFGCVLYVLSAISSLFPEPPETFEVAARRISGSSDPDTIKLTMGLMR